MNYSIKVNKLENKDWSTKAFVSIVFEESLKVTDITVKEAKNGELFVAMPTRATENKDGKREYTEMCYPVTKEFREQLYGEIIKKNSELKSREIDGEAFEKMREFGDENLPFR